jgi:hypothetical protein
MHQRRAGIAAAILFALLGIILIRSGVAQAAPTACQVGNGCTGTTTAPAYGKLLIGGKNGEYEFVASSTLSGGGSSFSTTSAAYWLTQQTTSGLAEGSNLYFTNARAVSALTGRNVSIFANDAGYITSAGAPVQSVFGRSGAIVGQSGDYTTSLIPEGTNLYWTQFRFDSALTATTSLPKITTLAGLSLPYAQLTGTPDLTQYLTLSSWYATTTDQLREGSSNLYFTNARVGSYISGSSTIPHTNPNAFGQLNEWNGSGWSVVATSSLGLPTFSGTNTWTGTNAFATTTASTLNGTVNVTGTPYARTSAGVQAALNFCSSLTSCGHVHLSAGTYSITTGVNIPSNILLDGDGYQTDLVESAGISISTASTSNITITNVRLDCSGQTSANDMCLPITNPLGSISVDHIWMTAHGFGIFPNATGTTTEVGSISITHSYLNGGNAIVRVNNGNVVINLDTVSNNATLGVNGNEAIGDSTWLGLSGMPTNGLVVKGIAGIGTSTPTATFQATANAANATTSLELGKLGQNKGTCITYFDTAGTAVYGFIAAGATAFTYTATKPSGCQN